MLFFAKLPKAMSKRAPGTREIKAASVTVLMLAVNQRILEVYKPWLTLVRGCPHTGVQTSLPSGMLYIHRFLTLSLRPLWKLTLAWSGLSYFNTLPTSLWGLTLCSCLRSFEPALFSLECSSCSLCPLLPCPFCRAQLNVIPSDPPDQVSCLSYLSSLPGILYFIQHSSCLEFLVDVSFPC